MRTYNSYYGLSTDSPPYSTGDIYNIINNSNASNVSYFMRLVNDALRYLTVRYFWNEESLTLTTVSGQQFYNLPAQLDKFINITVLIGNVLWQPHECSSRQFWDALNVIQFYQDYPYYYFIYSGQVGLWPTPTSSGDVITINYKSRIVDLTMPDVTNTTSGQTISAQNGSNKVTTSGSVFVNWMAQSVNSGAVLGEITGLVSGTTAYYSNLGDTQVTIEDGTEVNFTDVGGYTGITAGTTPYYVGNVTTTTFSLYTDQGLSNIVTLSGSGTAKFQVFFSETANPAGSSTMLQIPFSSSNSTSGDNQWYPISQVISGTTAYLSQAYQGQTVSGANFTIGQVPLLMEDYQDLPLYRAAMIYYTSRVPDANRATIYKNLYDEGIRKLDDMFTNKSSSVVLSDMDQPMVNPNLYIPKISQTS